MTVAELIAKLQQMPQDYVVEFMSSWEPGEIEVENVGVMVRDMDGKPLRTVVLA